MSRILIVFASSFGQTRAIAETIASQLRLPGHEVELADALTGRVPAPQGYDAVVVGSRVQMNRHASEIVEYMIRNKAALAARPTAFFSVSMAAANAAAADPEGYLATLFGAIGWHPTVSASFGGGLPYRRYGFVTRLVMKFISRQHGHTTDTSRNHEYTDWDAVIAFADRFAAELGTEPAVGSSEDDPAMTIPLPPGSIPLA